MKAQIKSDNANPRLAFLVDKVNMWAQELGFSQVGITSIDLKEHKGYLRKWLNKGYHGDMGYMERHFDKRVNPSHLIPETCRIISVTMNYLPEEAYSTEALSSSKKAYISKYALGRDYHKVMRKRLAKLAKLISEEIKEGNYRAFVDSAPVLERAIAENSGLGWIGKNTMLISKSAGSWFFLGEIYTDLPLPEVELEKSNHCGTCNACIKACPTNAFVEPYVLDARKCISYQTIENKGSIDESLRPLIGNRIFGCDDCQIVCPWNKYAVPSKEEDFRPRHNLNDIYLAEIFLWDKDTYLKKTSGSAIRRIGYIRWLRNIAVALGNAPPCAEIVNALRTRLEFPSSLVREHVKWALVRQHRKVSKKN